MMTAAAGDPEPSPAKTARVGSPVVTAIILNSRTISGASKPIAVMARRGRRDAQRRSVCAA
jgi:hypothetical protein